MCCACRSQRTIWRSVAAASQPGAVRMIRPTPVMSGPCPSFLPETLYNWRR